MDASGFVRHSKVFAGNVTEESTLVEMLTALEAPQGARVVMDRGLASKACLQWLRENQYRYLVVSRKRFRRFDWQDAVTLTTSSGQTVHLHTVTEKEETRLVCLSEQRAKREEVMARQLSERFEKALDALHTGLSRPRTAQAV